MANFVLEIPDSVIDGLKTPENEALTRIRQELAVQLYKKRLLPIGKAREFAQMSYWTFHELLADEGVDRYYEEDDLVDDLKTLDSLE